MAVVSSEKDTDSLRLTFVSEFDADLERVWELWQDPRQLERWWGPPGWPATFERHELRPGGESRYHMTGPDGEKSRGWWRTKEVNAPTQFTFEDGFAGDDGEPSGFLGTTSCTVTLDGVAGRTRMTVVSSFESLEQLEEMSRMGMQEGMQAALGQIDDIVLERSR